MWVLTQSSWSGTTVIGREDPWPRRISTGSPSRHTHPHHVSLLTSFSGICGVGIDTTTYLNRHPSSLFSTEGIISTKVRSISHMSREYSPRLGRGGASRRQALNVSIKILALSNHKPP